MRLQILTIARNTFLESVRQPIFFIMVLLCGLLQLFNTWTTAFSMGYTDTAEVSGDNKLLLDIGLATTFVCAMLLAAFIATAALSREIENRTVLTVVSKPVARPAVVLGKYLGIAGAMLLALVPMLLFLLMGIRHGVMSTAADDPDQPVILFTALAVGGSLLVAAWGNYFYGWHVTQTAVVLLAPGMLIAYVLVLCISKKWHWQPITADFKPQITIACVALVLAILVLTAVATTASTRLGQVMTTVVCAGVFGFGLVSNYLLGRHALLNRPAAIIERASWEGESPFEPGALMTVRLKNPPRRPLRVGDALYYGPSPNGLPMEVARYQPFTGNPDRPEETLHPETPPALVVVGIEGQTLRVKKVGLEPLKALRPPRPDDYLFTEPPRFNPPVLALWAIVPNMHYFWLVDAVSQNQHIPLRHLGLLALYSAAQIVAFLALGVILFERRDVG